MQEPRAQALANSEDAPAANPSEKKTWEAPQLDAVPLRETRNNPSGGLDSTLLGS